MISPLVSAKKVRTNEKREDKALDGIHSRAAGQVLRRIAALGASASKHDQKVTNLADALVRLADIVNRQGKEIEDLIQHGKDIDRRFEEADRRCEGTDARSIALILAVESFNSGK
jgi:hypothetical protein